MAFFIWERVGMGHPYISREASGHLHFSSLFQRFCQPIGYIRYTCIARMKALLDIECFFNHIKKYRT